MFWIDTTILIGSVLLLLGVLSSRFSAHIGMPGLVTFIGLGMIAGSEGIGGIDFEDYSLAYSIGTVVLVLILFSGGLGTPLKAIKNSWKPAGLLATAGVLVTAIVTGLAASWILDIPIPQGLLLGSIVGSTDASAVFAIFRAGGVHVRRSLADTIEVESGSNDPMAILLTVGLIEYLTGNLTSGFSLIWLFCNQMLVGLLVGIVVGYAAVWTIKAIRLEVSGLYPILATSFGLLSYGLAADLGGSGFLSVYLSGIVIGNNRVAFQRGIEAFHDAAAWLGQIVMFVLLGLLSFPSRLLEICWPGLAIAAVLILISRPLAVHLCLIRSRFRNPEKLFLSWVGLKGAVPITLAIFPLMSDIEGAATIFDIVFFIVIISAILQGTSLKWFANKLQLSVPKKREPPVTLEISSLHEVDADIVDYYIEAETLVVGKTIRDLALPEDVVVALVVRNRQINLPKGRLRIESGDHVIVVLRRNVRLVVDRIFSRSHVEPSPLRWPTNFEFPLRGNIRLGDLEDFYDVHLGDNPELTFDQWIRQQVPEGKLTIGTVVESTHMKFMVRELNVRKEITMVGMVFSALRAPAPVQPTPEPSPTPAASTPADPLVPTEPESRTPTATVDDSVDAKSDARDPS